MSPCSSRLDNFCLNNCFHSKYNFWSSQQIHHYDVGGITSNRFRSGWSNQGDMHGPSKVFELEKDSVTRTLVAEAMEPGISCESPSDDPSLASCLNVDHHVKSRFLTGLFQTPFQLSRTKCVRRLLTLGEIGAAVNLEVCSIKSFSLASLITSKYMSQVQHLVLLKIIQAFGTQFFNICKLESIKAGHPTELWKPCNIEDPAQCDEMDAVHEKAAKRDDAEVYTDLRNMRTLKIPKFVPS